MGDIAEGWNGFALLHNAASRVGGIDIGFVPHDGGVCSADQIKLAGKGELDVLFLLGADEYDINAMGKAFVVYVGTHGDAGAHRADVILPAAAYTEKSGTYVNTEGRVQIAERAVFPPGEAKEDWAIFRALSRRARHAAAVQLAARRCAPRCTPSSRIWRRSTRSSRPASRARASSRAARSRPRAPSSRSPIGDFYLTNPIARASAIMAECSQLQARPQAGGGVSGWNSSSQR